MTIKAVLSGLVLISAVSTSVGAQQQLPGDPNGDNLRDMLAAQIRLQGYACDRPLGAKRDAKRSRPDLGVWVLKCSNAVYRVRRAPDMSAVVERIKLR